MNDVFQSFMMGGFECSTHRNYTGKRIDVNCRDATRRICPSGLSTFDRDRNSHSTRRNAPASEFADYAENFVRFPHNETGANGLWDYANDGGFRPIYAPLADEIQRMRIFSYSDSL
jgi:hypothetical protein